MAGAAGALLALLSTYPLMTLNTRQHTEGGKKGNDNKVSTNDEKKLTTKKPTMVDELKSVIAEGDGISSLYRGIEPAVVGTVCSQLVYNYFYTIFRNAKVKSKNGNAPTALESLLIASLAGSINVVCTIPIWTVCVRMQAERKKDLSNVGSNTGMSKQSDDDESDEGNNSGVLSKLFRGYLSKLEGDTKGTGSEGTGKTSNIAHSMKSFLETTSAIYDESGVPGFWRGVVPSLLMVSNPALQYMFYETVGNGLRKRRVGRSNGTQSNTSSADLSFFEVFVAASLAKMGATVITYPVLLVKTRLQAGKGGGKGGSNSGSINSGTTTDTPSSPGYSGTFDALQKIIRDEGPAAFYRGMGTKMTQTVFAATLMFVTKEEIAKSVRVIANRVS